MRQSSSSRNRQLVSHRRRLATGALVIAVPMILAVRGAAAWPVLRDLDLDGVPTAEDRCPRVPEDRDGFEDEDGCPDPDNDGDHILDVDDHCPLEAEDRDGVDDKDGCDEPDNDKDGVLDLLDQCPLEPELINGNNDDDGCPDAGESLVIELTDRLDTVEPIRFLGSTAKLDKRAGSLLAQVAATLRARNTIRRLKVVVHVNPTANPESDRVLSERRAEEIRKFILAFGVEPKRMVVAGLGGRRPLVSPSKRGARELNERVELIILERVEGR